MKKSGADGYITSEFLFNRKAHGRGRSVMENQIMEFASGNEIAAIAVKTDWL